MATGQGAAEIVRDGSPSLTCNHEAPIIAHTLRADGFDASEDWQSGGDVRLNVSEHHTSALQASQTPAVAFTCKDYGGDAGELSPTLRSMGHADSHANGGGQVAVALPFDTTQVTSKLNRSNPKPGDPRHPLAAGAHAPAIAFDWQAGESGNDDSFKGKGRKWIVRAGDYTGALSTTKRDAVQTGMAVRRLTPRECERLMGFPDDYTLIPWRGKAAELCPDGNRYHALGNSWAVPVARWIGERIDAVDAILAADATRAAA